MASHGTVGPTYRSSHLINLAPTLLATSQTPARESCPTDSSSSRTRYNVSQQGCRGQFPAWFGDWGLRATLLHSIFPPRPGVQAVCRKRGMPGFHPWASPIDRQAREPCQRPAPQGLGLDLSDNRLGASCLLVSPRGYTGAIDRQWIHLTFIVYRICLQRKIDRSNYYLCRAGRPTSI